MERRLTAFLIPALVVALVWMLLPEPQARPTHAPQGGAVYVESEAQAQPGDIFTHDFGAPGQPGFRVEFDRRAGAVREIRLLDHYVSVEARDKAEHGTEDYYPIVTPAARGVPMLVLAERGERRFTKVRIDEQPEERPGREPGTTVEEHVRWTPTVTENEVRLTLDCRDGRTLEKVFRYEPGRRDLELEIRLTSAVADDPDAGSTYPLVLRGVMLPNPRSEHVIGGNPVMMVAGIRDLKEGVDGHVVRRDLPRNVVDTLAATGEQGVVTWAGATNRFFAGFLLPEDSGTRLVDVRVEGLPDPVDAASFPEADLLPYSVPFLHYGLELPVPRQGETSALKFRLYLGPKSFDTFASRPEYARLEPVMTEDLTPPGCFNVCNIPGVTWMATQLLKLLELLHALVGNWGVAIILLTVLVRSAVFFVNFRSQKAMRAFAAKMARFKPELDAIQAKYKDDPRQLQQAMMQLYREHKMFPPLGGCLPLFLTIPVFFGLFTALRVSYDLRHQPFVAWIEDLSAPDALFDTGLQWLPHFNVLPIVWMVLYSIMMFRMRLPADPQQRTVQQVMRWMFLLFGVFLYNYASGLLVYMCTSMSLTFLEQWLIKKILGPMPEVPGVPAAVPQF